MTKILIETKGDFELIDYSQSLTGLVIRADRPTVSADNSSFVSQRAAAGQIKVLGAVNDEATDEEFQKFWDESKVDADADVKETDSDEDKAAAEAKAKEDQKRLAVDAFSSSYAVSDESQTAKQEVDKKEDDQKSADSFTSTSAPQRGRKANA